MLALTSVAAAAILAVGANAQSDFINGNWYTNQVDTIQYTNFGSSGSYNEITSMDSNSGTCSSSPFAYSGSLAPLNGQVSVHMRGPFALKQFAFYSPSSSSKKSKRAEKKKRGHAAFHAKDEKRALGDWVTVTMDGQVVSWQNDWSGEATSAAPAAAATATAAAHKGGNVIANVVEGVVSAVSKVVAHPTAAPASDNSGPYSRSAYYESESQTAQGVTFLNNMGGQGSGVFDYTFGNSLSYASSDASSGAASPEILKDMTIPSDAEIILMTDTPCSGGSCGYSRDGTVAYEGFGGDDKIFVFEFSMPSDGTTGWNADMPALWLLNAQIPRTLQYGKADCSCWTSGCGEFDIMEVLDSGNIRCKSTLHGNVSGGDSAWIERPVSSTMQLAVTMSNSKATIKVLDGSFGFGSSLSQSDVDSFASDSSLGGLAASLFNLSK